MRGPNGPVWNGTTRAAATHKLLQPIGWREPREIFLNSLSDLWMDQMELSWIHRTFAMAGLAKWHKFQILTKRPQRQREYMRDPGSKFAVLAAAVKLATEDPRVGPLVEGIPVLWPLPNIILGVSVEDRARIGRIEVLRDTPAQARFLSLEPLLEPLGRLDLRGIDQVVVGGESKNGLRKPRPMPIEAAREIRDQCRDEGVAFHFKQIGSNHEGWPGSITGKGGNPNEWPEDLRVQQSILWLQQPT